MDTHNIEKIWPDWHVEKQLGKGSFGEVFEVSRCDSGLTSYAAVKVISIPKDSAELESIKAEGFDDIGVKTYLKGIVDDFIGEVKVMISLKGISNIVTVEDYKVILCHDNISWKIYIRMELLKSFQTLLSEQRLSESDVLKMGMDICSALEMCAKCGIIHRDIKPENIFVNRFGIFKLGDFGIARRIDNVSGGLSQKGTFNYMAPEVYYGNVYDERVDIYSLGIVMYKLLNNGLYPFLAYSDFSNHEARQRALDTRLKGTPIPAPCNASEQAANIVLKACAFRPDDRYSSAVEMKADIIKAMYSISASSAASHVPSAPFDTRKKNVGAVLVSEGAAIADIPMGLSPDIKSKTFHDHNNTAMLDDSDAERLLNKVVNEHKTMPESLPKHTRGSSFSLKPPEENLLSDNKGLLTKIKKGFPKKNPEVEEKPLKVEKNPSVVKNSSEKHKKSLKPPENF